MQAIIANCLYGIGNRITVICAAYACARLRGITPMFVWRNDWDCQCEYSDLFEDHPLVPQIRQLPVGAEVFGSCVYYPEWMPAHLKSAGTGVLGPDYWAFWRECALGFRLRPELALPEKHGFVAIHVRQNDHTRAEADNFIIQDLPAFVTCDSKSVRDKLLLQMPSAWSLDSEIVDCDYGEGCRTAKQIRCAARDMLMLTKASAILTIGKDSTFRNLAVLGYQIPCFKFYQGWNP